LAVLFVCLPFLIFLLRSVLVVSTFRQIEHCSWRALPKQQSSLPHQTLHQPPGPRSCAAQRAEALTHSVFHASADQLTHLLTQKLVPQPQRTLSSKGHCQQGSLKIPTFARTESYSGPPSIDNFSNRSILGLTVSHKPTTAGQSCIILDFLSPAVHTGSPDRTLYWCS